jgi:hypothetical protein
VYPQHNNKKIKESTEFKSVENSFSDIFIVLTRVMSKYYFSLVGTRV